MNDIKTLFTMLSVGLATCWAESQRAHATVSELEEYCGFDTFSPKCGAKEVIVMDVALYGRRQLGKCIRASDVEAFGEQYRFIGCFSDVISLVDARCSGKADCEIRIPDPVLQQASTCPQSLVMYMEATYLCVEVVQEDRSCVVSVSSHPLHITRSSVLPASQSNAALRCGTRTQPWQIEAPAGQRIRIDLFDFSSIAASGSTVNSTRIRDGTRSSPASHSSNSCTHLQRHHYGYIIDKSAVNKKNVSICGGMTDQRLSNVYVSSSSSVELVLAPYDLPHAQDQQANFLIKIEAMGCTNLVPPDDAWIKRNENTIVIGCYTSRQTWQLRCEDGRWIGVISNCTQSRHSFDHDMPTKHNQQAFESDQYEVIVIVAVCFAGLAVCLMIICCGLVFYKRFKSQRHQMDEKMHEQRPFQAEKIKK